MPSWHTRSAKITTCATGGHSNTEIRTVELKKYNYTMKLFANKSVSSDPNAMPLSTLIENNNEYMDVNFIGRNNH